MTRIKTLLHNQGNRVEIKKETQGDRQIEKKAVHVIVKSGQCYTKVATSALISIGNSI